MKSSKLTIKQNSSGEIEFAGLIISVRTTYGSSCDVVIGYPGLPNVERELRNGDAMLYETTENGIIEVRVISLNAVQVQFLVTQVAPKIGLLAGAANEDPNNSPFNPEELQRVRESLESLKSQIQRDAFLAPEQFDLLSRKIDEIQSASERMGRKDWINYVAGSLTSLCFTAAFAPEVTRKIFTAANAAFTWLFSTGILLLQ